MKKISPILTTLFLFSCTLSFPADPASPWKLLEDCAPTAIKLCVGGVFTLLGRECHRHFSGQGAIEKDLLSIGELALAEVEGTKPEQKLGELAKKVSQQNRPLSKATTAALAHAHQRKLQTAPPRPRRSLLNSEDPESQRQYGSSGKHERKDNDKN